ncbi:hypothetical protein [Cellulosimicrobium sp. Marseille-Q4280]|uniref:hypothetical protein n=1 Tax=Cellulosimicrobium sp. Marseille-Q4280 TaxID=2937992 RepID=UPI0020413B91|nr:hypothetical protein [Cellulosimicrobium sp. Marseille-Q4280]
MARPADGPTAHEPVEDLPPDDPDLAAIRRREQRMPRALAVGLGAGGVVAAASALLASGAVRWAVAVVAGLLLLAAAGSVVALVGVHRRWAPAVGAVPVARWTGTGRGSPEPSSRVTVVELAGELVPVPTARYAHLELYRPRALRGPVTLEVFRLAPDGRTGGPVRVGCAGRVAWAAALELSDEFRPRRREPRRHTPDLSRY